MNSPAAVKGYLAMNGALSSGVLPFPVRERIAILTAEFNNCTYCLSARDAKSVDPHVQAVLTLALAVLQDRGQRGDAAVRAAHDTGVTDAEIAEVVANVALNVLTNYFNELAGTELDFPEVTPRRA